MFTSLTTLFRSRPKALKAARPTPRTRLSLECLEARITPSHSHGLDVTVVVNSFNSVSVPGNHNVVVAGDIIIISSHTPPAEG